VEKSVSRRVRGRNKSTARISHASGTGSPLFAPQLAPLFAFDFRQQFVDGQLLQLLLIEPFQFGTVNTAFERLTPARESGTVPWCEEI
jgi:hypothetical protein